MSCHQKYSGVAKGFLLGSLLVFSIMFFGSNLNGILSPTNIVPFDEALARIKSDDIEKIRINEGTAEFLKDEQVAFATGVSEEQILLLFSQAVSDSKTVQIMPAESKHPLVYLIQILFWLFLISPPIIVVLLLVIIKKLDAQKS